MVDVLGRVTTARVRDGQVESQAQLRRRVPSLTERYPCRPVRRRRRRTCGGRARRGRRRRAGVSPVGYPDSRVGSGGVGRRSCGGGGSGGGAAPVVAQRGG